MQDMATDIMQHLRLGTEIMAALRLKPRGEVVRYLCSGETACRKKPNSVCKMTI